MRNRALHDALRDFALEAAALLTDDVRAGAELEFDVVDEGRGRGPALYHYRPRIEQFIGERWERMRVLPACRRAGDELGAGAAVWLRVNGLRGERAEPALRAMLERLYEDATSFGFPEERFERVYAEVERTLYRDAVLSTVVAPLGGVHLDAARVDLGDGLALVRGDAFESPPEAVWTDGEPPTLCVLERDTSPDAPLPAEEARRRFRGVVTALRLFRPGRVSLAGVGWRRMDGGRWSTIAVDASGAGRGGPWVLGEGEARELRDFVAAIEAAPAKGTVGWALRRFEIGCERPHALEALSDYLLGLRALLDATSDAGEASLALRVAALCAEEGERRAVQRRIELAIALERTVMGARPGVPDDAEELVEELEGHLRALLRDLLCGYLDAELKGVADDILLASREPFEIEARDLRAEADTEEVEAVAREAEPVARREREPEPGPVADPEPLRDPEPEPLPDQPALHEQHPLEGVTASADWGWGEAEDYSAPV